MFIIVIIVCLDFLLLNIFRLQNDLFSLKSYKNNNNDSVYSKLNNIASLVDVDMNKIDKTDAHFIPKYKQIKTT